MVDDDQNVNMVWMDMAAGGGFLIDVRYAMMYNSALYATSPDGGTAVGVLFLFLGG